MYQNWLQTSPDKLISNGSGCFEAGGFSGVYFPFHCSSSAPSWVRTCLNVLSSGWIIILIERATKRKAPVKGNLLNSAVSGVLEQLENTTKFSCDDQVFDTEPECQKIWIHPGANNY